ncbi:MAG: molybdate ABC transporter ATP-binding protein ModF [Thiofilum sp.]|uniref:molybdate ABC transporter ATP-binding protein ModF n=1 Tax=Thiofilum sp. TaxID=2212733 RepID=UPI0025E0D078|nr:molybdate ABC transporter ATP-binding protein ModF [Thiofilum sp.]MBK8453918.1 molybdate ABC transporter ATP-binding protein ModF [Thiofilum sp.]
MTISLNAYSAQFGEHFILQPTDWQIELNQHWVILGANGSGKSALAATLVGAGECLSGTITGLPHEVAIVSFEAQAELIEQERRKDDADILDIISEGTPVFEILTAEPHNTELLQQLIQAFQFEPLLQRSFRKLSTGETRKTLLIKALSKKPQLLILDEPFDGLDIDSMGFLQQLLQHYSQTTQLILVLNRLDEVPDFVNHFAYMDHGALVHQVPRSDQVALDNLYQLLHLKTSNLTIPPAIKSTAPALDPAQPLVKMRHVRIAYEEKVVLDNEEWTIEKGQHWQLTGPNGSGKTCLLNLITGDHPQCYVNDIFVFGMQRGTGESIWQIKQYIGYVSSALQWEYRVSISVRNVIISGFYDSIGLYQKYTETEKALANQWLDVLGMRQRADQPFNQLSFGDQRLLLIARAMVKHPALLILDEPCLGLDDMNRRLVLALIEKICAGTETTVLYVNHHPHDRIAGITHYKALG